MLYLTGIIDEALCNYDIMALYNQPNHSFYGIIQVNPRLRILLVQNFIARMQLPTALYISLYY